MSDIIPFTKKEQAPPEDPNIFVCRCGCSSFEFYSDGSVKCALCSQHMDSLSGEWEVPEAPLRPVDADPRVREVSANGDEDFARRVILKRGETPDVVAIVVVREDGSTHMWTNVEDQEQRNWLMRRIEESRGMLG